MRTEDLEVVLRGNGALCHLGSGGQVYTFEGSSHTVVQEITDWTSKLSMDGF